MDYLHLCSFAYKLGQKDEDTYQWAGNLCDLKVERAKKTLKEATDKYIMCSKSLVSVYKRFLERTNEPIYLNKSPTLVDECNKLKLPELVDECNKLTIENVSTHGSWIYKNYTPEAIYLLVKYYNFLAGNKRIGVDYRQIYMNGNLCNIRSELSKTVFKKDETQCPIILYDWNSGGKSGIPTTNLVETLGELISAYKKIQEREEELLHTVLQQRMVLKMFERDFKNASMMEAKREAKKATEKAKQAAIDAHNAMLAADEAVRLAEEAERAEEERLKKEHKKTLTVLSGAGMGDDDIDWKSYIESDGYNSN